MISIRGLEGISFSELEIRVFRIAAQAASELLSRVLEQIDEKLFRGRDAARYKVLDKRKREIDTAFGGTVNFSRRYYLDRETGERVHLLDEAVALPGRTRQSPGLRSISVNLAANGSYRNSRDALEQAFGTRVMSHESIRQQVLATGKKLKQLADESVTTQAEAVRPNKPKYVFIELDGIHCHLQRQKPGGKKNIEIKMMYAHEGWEENPLRKGKYRAERLRIRQVEPNTYDLEDVSGDLCSRCDIDKDTVVVIGGDRAIWIRKAVDYFGEATVLYQVDRFHLMRDLRRLFRANQEGYKRVTAVIDSDPTGGLFMAVVAEEMLKLPADARQKAESLLKDLVPIAECVCDYRVRLKARGIEIQGLRALGAAESRNSLFTARLKGNKKSWSIRGVEAMANTLAAKFEGTLSQVLHDLFGSVPPLPGEGKLRKEATRMALEHLENRACTRSGNIPVMGSGIVRTGGLSRLFRELATGQ